MRLVLPILMLILSSATVVLAGSGVGPDERRLAAVYPPWWSDARIAGAAASAGDIAAVGGLHNIIVIQGEPARLAAEARRSGALLLLGGDAARLCADIPSKEA